MLQDLGESTMATMSQKAISESIGKNVNKIKWKINHNVGTFDIYVISFASNKDNLLDIIPAIELLQKAYPKKDMQIIGLARGYAEALDVVQQIIEETYHETGGVDVWSYLKNNRGRKTR